MHNLERIAAPENYQDELRAITDRQLDARTIDTYADDALDALMILTQKIVAQYSYDPSLTGLENERQALVAVGLDPDTVNLTLDHIDSVAKSIKRLDALIQKRTKFIDTVIVPTDRDQTPEITPGDGDFKNPKETVPKLKTLLLLLEKGLDINIEDDGEVKISAGAVPSNIMRSTSYNSVEIPGLSRVVLTCDEIGNATYIFDTEKCASRNIQPDALRVRTKKELNDLVDDDALLGRRLIYSEQYAERVSAALTQPFTLPDAPENQENVSLLVPPEILDHIPPEYATVNTMAEELGLTWHKVHRLMRSIGKETFGHTKKYRPPRYTGGAMLILSPEQQELLRSYAHREVPEGSMTFKALADKFGVDITTIGHWVRVAGDTLGDIIVIDDHARKGSPYRILSPEQQELLRTTFLTQAEKIEGYMTVKEVARHLNTTHTIIKRRIKEGASSLGEIKMLQRGRERLLYLSPDQVKILEQIHSEKKIISYIPPGYATTTEVCNTLGIAYGRLIYIVYRILSESELGSLSRYHGGTRVPPQLIFSPEQQELIAEKNDQIERRGGHAVIAAARKEGSQSS